MVHVVQTGDATVDRAAPPTRGESEARPSGPTSPPYFDYEKTLALEGTRAHLCRQRVVARNRWTTWTGWTRWTHAV